MAKAGENEKIFEDLCNSFNDNVDKKLLSGKIVFEDADKNSVSVDNSIIVDDKIILIEIDSANEAKLLAGQYTLLNLLKDKPKIQGFNQEKKELIFFVIHFYVDRQKGRNKPYNSDRTKKNLKLIRNVLSNKGLRYGCIHFNDIENIKSKNDLLRYIESKIEKT